MRETEGTNYHYHVDKAKGVVKEVTVYSRDDIEYLELTKKGWIAPKTLAKIEVIETKHGEEPKKTTRYYLSSLHADSALIWKAASSHWGIENNLHWILDVMFNEDKACFRNTNVAENMNVVRKIVTNTLYFAQTDTEINGKKKTLSALSKRFSKISEAKKMIQNYLNF